MTTAIQFGLDIDRKLDDMLDGGILELTKTIALDAAARITRKSPVKTGRFRFNNHVSVGTGSEEMFDGTGDPSPRNEGDVGAVRRPYIPIHVQNNLPYANRLEGGYSSQAEGEGAIYAVTFAELMVIYG